MKGEMNTSDERPLRMMVVYADSSGFYVAMVPASLSLEQVEAAFREFGIEAEQMIELGGWRTSSDDVAVAHVPLPDGK
jgi:hypothetical protein